MRYTTAQISYHWISFLLILGMVGTGLAYRYDLAGSGAMQAHQIMGQLLIVALILRIISRLKTPVKQTSAPHTEIERRLAQIVQLGLYATMIAFVVTGYISASAETDSLLIAPVSLSFARSDMGEQILEIHYLLKWVLLGFVGLHVAGALKHHFWDKDTTLTDMTFTARKG